MARKRAVKSDEADFLRVMRDRYDAAYDAERENFESALEDMEFRAGKQWPADVEQDRKEDGRPIITINRMGQFVRQVTGDIRINTPSIKVRPADEFSDPPTAEVITGLCRHIQAISQAKIAYTTAADNAATCGYGAFRVITQYADDDVFDQDIRIKRIRNPLSVIWDPDSEEITKEDAKFAFITDLVSLEAFKSAYPTAKTDDFERGEVEEWLGGWWTGEKVRVAEYWVKQPTTKDIVQLEDGSVVDADRVPDGAVVVKTRTVQTHKVVQYIVSGSEVLEGPTEWPGKFIPIIPVIGEEVYVGERTMRHGIVRFAKDPQRLYNYWRTTAAETIALSPKAPFILTQKQINGHEAAWKAANRSNLPYLLYNPEANVLKPSREPPAPVPAALVTEANIASDDMKAVIGIYDAALGQRSNETSGKAILARQQEGDVGTYVYVDNLATAIAYCGRILVDLIPRIYDSARVIRILGEDEKEMRVPINQETPDGLSFDLTRGKYDVVVETGPSYSTKRIEAANSMSEFVKVAPQAFGLIGDLMVKNMDWPGADAISKRLKKMLPPGLDEDAGPQPPPPPPPPDPALLKIEQDNKRLELEAMKAQGDFQFKQQELALKAQEMELKKAELQARAQEIATTTETERARMVHEGQIKTVETQLQVARFNEDRAARAEAQQFEADKLKAAGAWKDPNQWEGEVKEVAAAIQQMAQAVVQQGQMLAQQIQAGNQAIIDAVTADVEAVRDANGRMVGTKKVMKQRAN